MTMYRTRDSIDMLFRTVLFAVLLMIMFVESRSSARNLMLRVDSTLSVRAGGSATQHATLPPLQKSPTGAVLRSLVFPGWGQFYNESYLKSAAFAVGAVSITSIIVWNDVRYADARTRYDALPANDALKERTYKEKEFYRDQRDVAGLWLLGVYALASIDAYVGAHLFDFDVSEKGVTCMPLPTNGALASVNINVRF